MTKQDYKEATLHWGFSDGEHHQHMEIDSIGIIEGKQQ